MTKYKLKKDLLDIKAGTILKELDDSSEPNELHISTDSFSLKIFRQDGNIQNFDDWFEEVKEFEEWKPEKSERYKFMSEYGEMAVDGWYREEEDEYRLSTGNCYPVDTPDEEIIKEQKLIPQALHRLKMAAKKAWFEYGEDCDWNDEYQTKYCIAYNFNSEEFFTNSAYLVIVLGAIGLYFPTKESAQNIIDTMQDDLKLVMGIE